MNENNILNNTPVSPTSPYKGEVEDDGGLACLGLDTDRSRKTFNCPAKRQTDLVDKTFWVLDYFGDIESKDGKKKYLFKAKFHLEDADSEAFKVWSGSPDVWYILDKIGELNKFPRRVTLRRRSRGAMFFE